MIEIVKIDIQKQYDLLDKSKQIFEFVRKKHDHDFNNFIINVQNINNYISTLRKKQYDNMTFIQNFNVILHNNTN